jgi:hypothetical protein
VSTSFSSQRLWWWLEGRKDKAHSSPLSSTLIFNQPLASVSDVSACSLMAWPLPSRPFNLPRPHLCQLSTLFTSFYLLLTSVPLLYIQHSSGRGGAGNIRSTINSNALPPTSEAQEFPWPRGRERAPVARANQGTPSARSTGRGGSGNFSQSPPVADPSYSLRDSEILRAHAETEKVAIVRPLHGSRSVVSDWLLSSSCSSSALGAAHLC